MLTIVQLEGVDGSEWNFAGPEEGSEGVYLGKDGLSGIYDPPVKVVDEEPGNYPGARYLWHRILKREILLPLDVYNDREEDQGSWMTRDSLLRKAFAYDRPAKLKVTTEYGTRYLLVWLAEAPDIKMDTDPNENPVNRAIYSLVAYDPFWYGPEDTFETKTTVSTLNGSSQTLYITVDASTGGLNPTDQPICPVWYIDAPSKVTVPDYNFDVPGNNRRIVLPELFAGEDLRIDTDLRERQLEADNNAPVWYRMNGVRFRNMIPAYTEARTFELTVTKAPIATTITLELERPWSRPWGLT